MKKPKDCPGKFGSGPETEIAIQRKSYRTLCIGLIATTKESSRSEMISKIFFLSGIKFLGVIIKPTALGMLPNATFHLYNYILKPIVIFPKLLRLHSLLTHQTTTKFYHIVNGNF